MGKLISFNEYKVIDVDVDEDTIKECFIDLFDNYDTDFAVYTEFYYVGCSLEYSDDIDDIDKIVEYMYKRNAIIAEMNYSIEKLKLIYPAVSYKICKPTLSSNDNFRTDTRYRKFSMMIGKKFDKVFKVIEGM